MRYQIENGTVSLGGKTILDHIDFSVKGREKVAVVGRNGAGKTTLLRLISGELSLDRDDKNFGKGIKTDRELSIGFLHQQSFQDVEKTVEQEIISLVNEEDIFSRERYYFEKEYDRIFTGFGFQKEDKKKKIKQFSGGEQTKLALIKLLLSKPDILLLDEPTNHLDIASVEWLEEYLASYEKAVIMVSHDRFFVDRTTEIIYELADGKLTRYVGNYTEYKRQKEKQREVQQKKYDAQQKEIARLNELIEKFKHKPKKASMARSKKKVLERMQRVERPDKEEAYVFKEKLEPITLGAKNVLETEHLKIGYTIEHPIKELTLRIRRGQKIAVLGANGAGKSTFFKTIIGELPPISGKYVIGKGIMTGYFDQHSGEISSEKRVEEYFGECFPKLTEKEKRQVLGKYLFRSQKANMKISDLSGGEKSRLVLAEILESRPNFLVLDEPTNHMDLPAKETMESAFAAYTGTMLFISHDRYFVSKIADALLLFEEDGVKYYPFGYEHYLHMLKKKREGTQTWAEVVEAENTALVEGLFAVPSKERHQTARFSTEQSYTDWQLALAKEEMEKYEIQLEKQQEEIEFAEQTVTFEEYQSGNWKIKKEELQKQFEKIAEEYQEQCLIWYEKWQEYEEAFLDYV
nr:ABC-F family ATP-binding cassette domain-containing protein [uncultured Anaerobutyricum sp.]